MDYSLLVGVRRKTFFVNDPRSQPDTVSAYTPSLPRPTLASPSVLGIGLPPPSPAALLSHHQHQHQHLHESGLSAGLRGSLQHPSRTTSSPMPAPSLSSSSAIAPVGISAPPSIAKKPLSTELSDTSSHSSYHPPTLPTVEEGDSTPVVRRGVSLSQRYYDDPFAIPAAAVEGAGSFQLGIIDTLQEWNWSKWNERMFKTIVLRKDGEGLSAIEPRSYRKRFMQRAVLDVMASVNYRVKESSQDGEDDGHDLYSINSDTTVSNSTMPQPVTPMPNSLGLASPSPALHERMSSFGLMEQRLHSDVESPLRHSMPMAPAGLHHHPAEPSILSQSI
jgi:hypothetical protein